MYGDQSGEFVFFFRVKGLGVEFSVLIVSFVFCTLNDKEIMLQKWDYVSYFNDTQKTEKFHFHQW